MSLCWRMLKIGNRLYYVQQLGGSCGSCNTTTPRIMHGADQYRPSQPRTGVPRPDQNKHQQSTINNHGITKEKNRVLINQTSVDFLSRGNWGCTVWYVMYIASCSDGSIIIVLEYYSSCYQSRFEISQINSQSLTIYLTNYYQYDSQPILGIFTLKCMTNQLVTN